MPCYGVTLNNAQVKNIEWFQITPLLVNAEKVFVKKQKIDQTGAITNDVNKWAVGEIIWDFEPIKEPLSTMEINTIGEDGLPDSKLSEKFDFLSGAFKFFYDTKNNEIYGEISKNESGFDVTYRYTLEFYGFQKISEKDLLQKSITNCNVGNLNNVISL